mmetsp:Transcript_14020/g.34705  ORF Transcript_14020/g.34705 Transcript_14020/m.34705 type:complete len:283 (+) Transcript_14020:720-1568(+)
MRAALCDAHDARDFLSNPVFCGSRTFCTSWVRHSVPPKRLCHRAPRRGFRHPLLRPPGVLRPGLDVVVQRASFHLREVGDHAHGVVLRHNAKQGRPDVLQKPHRVLPHVVGLPPGRVPREHSGVIHELLEALRGHRVVIRFRIERPQHRLVPAEEITLHGLHKHTACERVYARDTPATENVPPGVQSGGAIEVRRLPVVSRPIFWLEVLLVRLVVVVVLLLLILSEVLAVSVVLVFISRLRMKWRWTCRAQPNSCFFPDHVVVLFYYRLPAVELPHAVDDKR